AFDAPSLILLCSASAALAGVFFSRRISPNPYHKSFIALMALFVLFAILNSSSMRGIRPVIIKGNRFEPAHKYLSEYWNSFSRVTVYPKSHHMPHYWGASPIAPTTGLDHYDVTIDGEAGTVMCSFKSMEEIDHLRYDLVNMAHHIASPGNACIIGVGAGRDVQCAILFGHKHITGLEINPIFINLLKGEFRDFARIADRPDVKLVKAEARSYLSSVSEKYSIIQMSLVDTWAATGAGAFSLSENSLYTLEAWDVFLDRLSDEGIFTVSRWHSPEHIGETGRLISLAAGSLLHDNVSNPSNHIAVVTTRFISNLMVKKSPFTKEEIERLSQACRDYQFEILVMPGNPPEDVLLGSILAASSYEQLLEVTNRAKLNCSPTTDESPYFFNMLRLRNIREGLKYSQGVIKGNVTAALTLSGLLVALLILTVLTIIIPLALRKREPQASPNPRTLWLGAFYFSLIGAAFMFLEIALIQRLAILLSHPIYAFGILLFSIIASAGIGSFLSDRIRLRKGILIYALPGVMAVSILIIRFLLSGLLKHIVTASFLSKTIVSVGIIIPLGIIMGMFFPIGMRLAKSVCHSDAPWYWALNGIFGVLCSALAVFVSIYAGISINFYIASSCYALTIIPLYVLRRKYGNELPGDRLQDA
ncbi:hypothetical protein JW926_09785, partial [Candidatus Sumerlaeota bacterium]|nr:hypothetical protein [Candidatus Sumerlaeota bacterium]